MNTRKSPNVAQTYKDIKRYEFVLKAFIALEHKLCTIAGVTVHQGRVLYTDSSGSGTRHRRVTPDMVIEVAGPKNRYRAINEIKGSLPRNPKNWNEIIAQLEKYKRVCTGWVDPLPGNPHNVIMTLRGSDADAFAGHMAALGSKSDINTWPVVIKATPTHSEGGEGIEIAIVQGRISNPKISSLLSDKNGCRIQLYQIVKKIDQMKFYDSHPPIPYTMTILWDHVFSKFLHGRKIQEFNEKKAVKITVSMGQIYMKIKKFAPSSNAECIEQSWIKTAMNHFEKMRVVSHNSDGTFEVTYKKHGKSTMDWIVRNAGNFEGRSAKTPRNSV